MASLYAQIYNADIDTWSQVEITDADRTNIDDHLLEKYSSVKTSDNTLYTLFTTNNAEYGKPKLVKITSNGTKSVYEINYSTLSYPNDYNWYNRHTTLSADETKLFCNIMIGAEAYTCGLFYIDLTNLVPNIELQYLTNGSDTNGAFFMWDVYKNIGYWTTKSANRLRYVKYETPFLNADISGNHYFHTTNKNGLCMSIIYDTGALYINEITDQAIPTLTSTYSGITDTDFIDPNITKMLFDKWGDLILMYNVSNIDCKLIKITESAGVWSIKQKLTMPNYSNGIQTDSDGNYFYFATSSMFLYKIDANTSKGQDFDAVVNHTLIRAAKRDVTAYNSLLINHDDITGFNISDDGATNST